MKWRNVFRLISVDIKAGRLLRSREFRRYRENKFLTYALYIGAVLVGVAIAAMVLSVYATTDATTKQMIHNGAITLFLSFPSLIFIYSLILTLMGQIQRMGVKISIQPPYWLPVTWSEHTIASIITILLGIPLASILLIGSIVAVLSIFFGEIYLAIFTISVSFASAFIASTTTEIFRVFQLRLIGAVYKSSGRAAIWVRFIGSMLFFAVFYLIWFAIASGANSIAFIESISGWQRLVWFIPYVWPGMALYSFFYGLFTETFVFITASIFFMLLLFYIAVKLNTKYGLYEPPAITISQRAYSPKTGFLPRLGFSSLETAIIRKDFKAFFRRKELMYIFILPIVFIIMPIMQSFGATSAPTSVSSQLFFSAWLLLVPGPMMAVITGEMILGEEGQAVWHFFSSPISASGLLKCKYTIVASFAFLIMVICSVIGILVFQPSIKIATVSLIEAVFLTFALAMVSIESGIRGADFVEIPRPRMIRTGAALTSFILCMVIGLAILAPLLPHVATRMGMPFLIPFDIYISLVISGVIASAVAYIFYRLALKRAKDFLTNAEV